MPLVPIDKVRIPNDETLLPLLREEVFLQNEYKQAFLAYEGWGEFPPVTVDQDYLLLDGVTRIMAARQAGLTEVKVELLNCESQADRLRFAARANSKHGKRWETKDIVNLANLADRFGVSREDLATDLRIPITRIERIPVATIVRAVPGGTEMERVYVKKPLRPYLNGKELTPREVDLMDDLSTASTADVVLADFLRLSDLKALPPLTEESLKTARAVQVAIDAWIERDEHLLTVEVSEEEAKAPLSLNRLWKRQAGLET